jgi:hypothetical protein
MKTSDTIYTDYLPLKASLTTAFGAEGFVDPATNKTLDKADFDAMTYAEMQKYADTIIAE